MKKAYLLLAGIIVLASCTKTSQESPADQSEIATAAGGNSNHESATFGESGMIDLGETGAAEISTFDPLTKRLFVVNNTAGNNRIDVVDLSNPAAPVLITSIPISIYGGLVNSVYVKDGKLAAAIEATPKTNPGKVVVFNTQTYAEIAVRTVGALPDMVTISPDGKYILSANEGEPNDAYTIDPPGTVSIIDITDNYSVTTLDFSGFASQAAQLKALGLRVFGPNASFAQDMEPEYIAVSANSNTAWVTLQENNGLAKIDLRTKSIRSLFPLGFKNFNLEINSIDPSDQDGAVGLLGQWPVKGIYCPDAIAVHPNNGIPYVYSANEGDAREWAGFVENVRLGNAAYPLDPTAFPNAAVNLKPNSKLGRLNVTKTLGDTDGDGDYDEIYAQGARSFSIWNGNTGELIFDSKNDLDKRALAAGKYVDSRSDDKSIEPEGIVIGRVGNKNLLFVGLERSDAVAVYNITDPDSPVYLQWLNCGVGPEGLAFVSAADSPNGRSLLIVSSEVDGIVKVFTTE
jgi:DNA-binding beta-propeller fold protein YncE